MPWARMDDNYFTHPKIAELSKDAKLLDLAAIAFSARELRDGILSAKDARVIAAQVDVAHVTAVAEQLIAAGRWERSETGYVIHDYLKYNPSRAAVIKERADNARRVSGWRDKQRTGDVSEDITDTSSNGLGNDSSNGACNAITAAVRTSAPYPVPYPIPVNEQEPGETTPKGDGAAPKNGRPPPKENRTAQVIDAFRALKIEPVLTGRDYAAIKRSNAPPEHIAEVYDQVARCEYGDDFMRRRLSVHEAIEWVNGYIEWKAEKAWRTNGST